MDGQTINRTRSKRLRNAEKGRSVTDGPKSWPENGRRDIQMVEISYRNVIHKKKSR